MSHTVDVRSATSVMAREDSLELSDTIIVGLLQATKERVVQVGRVVGVTIAAGLNTGVNTLNMLVCGFTKTCKMIVTYSRVAVPDIHVDFRSRLAGLGVDKLDIEEKGDALLVLCDIRTDHFTSNICH